MVSSGSGISNNKDEKESSSGSHDEMKSSNDSEKKTDKYRKKAFTPCKKIPLILFGDAIFDGDLCKRCRVLLKKAEKEGRLVMVLIWEHNTSKTYSKCLTKTLDNKKLEGSKMHAVLKCKKCGTLWQWDLNASRNMVLIFYSLVRTCVRPEAFCPVSRNNNDNKNSGRESHGNI